MDTENGDRFAAYPESKLTHEIIGAAYEVRRELLPGYSENVYRNALQIALEDRGVRSDREFPIQVRFRGREAGAFRCDLLVQRRVRVETTAGHPLNDGDSAQLLNQMPATGIGVGLLVHFGKKVTVRRFVL